MYYYVDTYRETYIFTQIHDFGMTIFLRKRNRILIFFKILQMNSD